MTAYKERLDIELFGGRGGGTGDGQGSKEGEGRPTKNLAMVNTLDWYGRLMDFDRNRGGAIQPNEMRAKMPKPPYEAEKCEWQGHREAVYWRDTLERRAEWRKRKRKQRRKAKVATNKGSE